MYIIQWYLINIPRWLTSIHLTSRKWRTDVSKTIPLLYVKKISFSRYLVGKSLVAKKFSRQKVWSHGTKLVSSCRPSFTDKISLVPGPYSRTLFPTSFSLSFYPIFLTKLKDILWMKSKKESFSVLFNLLGHKTHIWARNSVSEPPNYFSVLWNSLT